MRRFTNILAVVGLAAALATLVAYILAFRAHGLWGFFGSVGLVVLFLCLCAISGGACWWASTRTERLYQGSSHSRCCRCSHHLRAHAHPGACDSGGASCTFRLGTSWQHAGRITPPRQTTTKITMPTARRVAASPSG